MKKIYKLTPITFANIWGGNKLRMYGKTSDSDRIGESWELSFVNGREAEADGIKASELFKKSSWGTRAEKFDFFPVLTKFIDAKEKLSVQVHPSDEYALKHEGQYGKSEMWYVVSADEGAGIYIGFNQDFTKQEIKDAVSDGSIENMLSFKSVKAGDVFFIPAGTVHAICGGVLIFEIQQNSTLTYRLYDYQRRDENGNTRELHVDMAMNILNTGRYLQGDFNSQNVSKRRLIGQCEYFTVNEYSLTNSFAKIVIDDSSFKSLTVVSGECKIETCEEQILAKQGDSFFIPAQSKTDVTISGNATVISVEV